MCDANLIDNVIEPLPNNVRRQKAKNLFQFTSDVNERVPPPIDEIPKL